MYLFQDLSEGKECFFVPLKSEGEKKRIKQSDFGLDETERANAVVQYAKKLLGAEFINSESILNVLTIVWFSSHFFETDQKERSL